MDAPKQLPRFGGKEMCEMGRESASLSGAESKDFNGIADLRWWEGVESRLKSWAEFWFGDCPSARVSQQHGVPALGYCSTGAGFEISF